MKKQRWRKTKPKMKDWQCHGCNEPMKVREDHEPAFCCYGYECGCYGETTNPVFCDKCVRQLFGEPAKRGSGIKC